MIYIMYNPLANNKRGHLNAMKAMEKFPDSAFEFVDLPHLFDYGEFFDGIQNDDTVVFTGGDGTINRFVNSLGSYKLKHDVLYFPAGSGNDFMNDVKADSENGMIVINKYIEELPVATVNGKDYKVVNGVGFGLDGYCCEEGDRVQRMSEKPVNYTAIALKGFLGKYKPTNATVTVDGVTTTYEKAWIAPTMNGRFFGGGMMITPDQDRLNPERTVSGLILSGASRVRILTAFPRIFKGTHTKLNVIKMFKGHEVKVEFDQPRPLQIDGETIPNVTSYVMRSSVLAGKKKEEKEALA